MSFIFLFFFSYLSKASNIEKSTKKCVIIDPNTNFNNFSYTNYSNNEIEFIVFNTSYSNQLIIDLFSDQFSSHKTLHYSFKSLNDFETEYVYFKNAKNYDLDLSFHSIFVTFSSNNMYIKNLTLFESPIGSSKEKIDLTVDYLKSDFFSLPKTTVSTVNIKKEFIYLEDSEENKRNFPENHATIILSSNSKQKFTQVTRAIDSDNDNFNQKKSIEKAELLNDNSNLNEETLSEETESIPSSFTSEDLDTSSFEGEDETKSIESEESFTSLHPASSFYEEFESSQSSSDDFSDISQSQEETELFSETPSFPFDFDPDNNTNSTNSTNFTEPIDFYLNTSLTVLTLFDEKVEVFYENQENETIKANSTGHLNIFTNSSSFSVRYKSDGYLMTSLKLNLYLLVECAIIFDHSWRILGGQILTNIVFYHSQNHVLTLMTDLDEVPYVTVMPALNVRYVPERPNTESYCLCTKTRLEQCIENEECFLYSVPIDHYYSSSNSIISSIIANSKAITINLYLTYTSFNDVHQFSIKPIIRSRKNLNFISVVPTMEVNLQVFDLSRKRDINKVIMNCVDISNVHVSLTFQNSVDTIILKNSPFVLHSPLSINNFVSDAYSLNRLQSNIVNVYECLAINRSEMNSIGIKFMLHNNATLEVKQISMFPTITIRPSQISFAGNEEEFSVGFNGAFNVKISERTRNNPTVTVTFDVPYNSEIKMIMNFLLENSIIIDFRKSIPFPNGIQINFVPSPDELTSLELLMPDTSDYFDGSYRIFPFGNISGNIDLILASSESVRSFMNSLHHNDFTVSNLSQISLNFNDNLKSVTFFDESIAAKVSDGIGYLVDLQFDRLFINGQMTIISNSTEVIEMSLNYSDYLNTTGSNESLDFGSAKPGLTSKMQDFVLKTTNQESCIFFDDSFSAFMNNSVLSKIKIDHETSNVKLRTNLTTIPNIQVIDDISGVLYYAQLETVNLTHSFNESDTFCEALNDTTIENETNLTCNILFDSMNYRSGPNITVLIEKENILVSQNQFLAENVTFLGKPFSFISKTKSRCKYNFVNISHLKIIPTENSTVLNLSDLNSSNSDEPKSDIKIKPNSTRFDFDIDSFLKGLYDKLEINASLFSRFFRAEFVSLLRTPINFDVNYGENVLFLVEQLKSDVRSLSMVNPSVSVAADIFTLVDDSFSYAIIDSKSLSASYMLVDLSEETFYSSQKKPKSDSSSRQIKQNTSSKKMIPHDSSSSSFNQLNNDLSSSSSSSFNQLNNDLSSSSFNQLNNDLSSSPFNQINNDLSSSSSFNQINNDLSSSSSFNQINNDFSSSSSFNQINNDFFSSSFGDFKHEVSMLDESAHASTMANYRTPFVTSSLFIVHHLRPSTLYVSLASKEIKSQFFFVMDSKSDIVIHLDNSWYQAKNADQVTFIIMNALHHTSNNETFNDTFSNFTYHGQIGIEDEVNVTVETDLYEMPNIRVVDSFMQNITYRMILYQPVWDASMSFYIFLALACVITVISVIFLIMSIFCYKKYELEEERTQNDISNSSRSHPSKVKKPKPKKNIPIENISESIDKSLDNNDNNNESYLKNIHNETFGTTSLSIAIEDSF